MVRHWLRQWVQFGITLVGWWTIATPIPAQIIPDNTLPNNSTVAPGCAACAIDGGTIRGTNLFHSFEQFSVPIGGEAYFNNPAQIQTILTRVTGKLGSNIDGLIRTNGTANLFLMNPNGIIFGTNASLNVGGSFVATTADAIQFGDQGFFSASNPTAPSLLTINPSAFWFNQLNPGAIQSKAGLVVPTGQSLLLVGGPVVLEDSILVAQGGRIELGGLAAAGSVRLLLEGNSFKLSFPDGVPRSDVSLTKSVMFVPSDGGGDIAITANNVDVSGSSFFAGILPGLGQTGSRSGDIVLDATGDITLSQGSDINSAVYANATGNVGDIFVKARSLTLTDGSRLFNFHNGVGNTGNIAIITQDTVSLSGKDPNGIVSNISSQGLAGRGNTGSIQIQTRQLLLDGGDIRTSTNRRGAGGNITIDARDAIVIKGSVTTVTPQVSPPVTRMVGSIRSDVSSSGIGNSGMITLSTGSLTVSNEGAISASTSGQGNAGNLTIDVRNAAILDGGSVSSSVQEQGVGNGGNLVFSAGSLSVTNGSQLTAIAAGRGDAGNLTLTVRDRASFIGETQNGIPSGAFSSVTEGAKGNSGQFNLSAGSLFVTKGAQLSASTSGQGNAGNLTINVSDTAIVDGEGRNGTSSQLSTSVQAEATGNGGDLFLSAGSLFVTKGAQINADTFGQGNAGKLTIVVRDTATFDGEGRYVEGRESGISRAGSSVQSGAGNADAFTLSAGSLVVTNGAQLNTATFAQGNAGNLTITIRDTATFKGTARDGTGSAAGSSVESGATGKGGRLTLAARQLQISDRAFLKSASSGDGPAGDLSINAQQVRLENQAAIRASSRSSDGANITLNVGELLLMRRGSEITASAGLAGGGGNGGNITINAPQGFIVAVQSENSDISANAFSGSGGRVNIAAQGIYGLQFQPRLTPFSDITASSTLGVSGVVTLNTPDIDPSRGLIELPTDLVDPTNKIDQRCAPRGGQPASSFTVTGRGGLASSPIEPLMPQDSLMELVKLPEGEMEKQAGSSLRADETDKIDRSSASSVPPSAANEIIEASRWITDAQGNVQLVADASGEQPYSLAMGSPMCAQR